jgi:hypothetical protein
MTRDNLDLLPSELLFACGNVYIKLLVLTKPPTAVLTRVPGPSGKFGDATSSEIDASVKSRPAQSFLGMVIASPEFRPDPALGSASQVLLCRAGRSPDGPRGFPRPRRWPGVVAEAFRPPDPTIILGLAPSEASPRFLFSR